MGPEKEHNRTGRAVAGRAAAGSHMSIGVEGHRIDSDTQAQFHIQALQTDTLNCRLNSGCTHIP